MVASADVSQALLTVFGILGAVASLMFVFMFATKLGIWGGAKVSEFTPTFLPRIQNSYLGGLVRSKKTTYKTLQDDFLTASEQTAPSAQRARKSLWQNKLPMRRDILAQIQTLSTKDSQVFAVLTADKPPTVVLSGSSPSFGVTGLQIVSSLNNFSQLKAINEATPIVATLHNHRRIPSPSDQDWQTFAEIDSLLGTKLHVICTRERLLVYCLDSFHGPRKKG
jgi:hypothetical protein